MSAIDPKVPNLPIVLSLWGSRIRTKISFWCGKSLAFSYEMAVLQSQKVETGSIFH